MGTLKRSYTQKTLKLLWGLSRGQCAHPNCSTALIEPATNESEALVVGHVCHILALNADGSRGSTGLTEKQLNSPDNLILFCPTHHTIVDGQHESYPAENANGNANGNGGMTSVYFERHGYSRDLSRRVASENIDAAALSSSGRRFPTPLVDQEIERQLLVIRRSRFFQEFPTVERCLGLGTELTRGDYSGGTPVVRGRALAWCARLLVRTDELDAAKEYLREAKKLGAEDELAIANALLLSRQGDRRAALAHLADLNSPIARSAALGTVSSEEGAAGAVRWARDARVTASDLDSDGKVCLLGCLLETGDWDASWAMLDSVSPGDAATSPALDRLTALAHLLRTVPEELRAAVCVQVPSFAAHFPLASGDEAVRERDIARRGFRSAAAAAREVGCTHTADADEEYALWLGLRDPLQHAAAREELQARLEDPEMDLRWVPLALHFDLQLDMEAVDREIRGGIARSGGNTPVTAAARLALAITRPPEATIGYIARYCDDLTDHVDETELRRFEVALLIQAGHVNRARRRLDGFSEGELSDAEAKRLRVQIAGAEGSGSLARARQRFEETHTLVDLVVLVERLRSEGPSVQLCVFSQVLFERTETLEDAETVAMALSETQEWDRLAEFLGDNEDLVRKSHILGLCLCWSLFCKGSLLEARERLKTLTDCRDHPNYLALRVQLAIGLGDWETLANFVEEEYQARTALDEHRLFNAAQLAVGLRSPRAKELTFAAASQVDQDAELLAGLHLLAVSAGWDNEPEVAQWLHRAAACSDDDGPVREVTLETLTDEVPQWQAGRLHVLQLLERGETPFFLAAQYLNSSLSNLILRPALANLSIADPRRRTCVPAYGGHRGQIHGDLGGRAGIDPAALLTLGFLDLLDECLDAFEAVYIGHSTLNWLFTETRKASFHQPSRLKDARLLRDLLAQGRIREFEPNAKVDDELSAKIGDELAMLIAEAEIGDPGGPQRVVVRPFPVHRLGSLLDEEVDLGSHAAVLSSCQAIVDALQGLVADQKHQTASSYLKLHEKPWPEQPDISSPANLFLDSLATTYFLRLELLEVLHDGDFTVFVTPTTVSEARDILAYEGTADKVHEILDRIRCAVSPMIADGRVRVGPLQVPESSEAGNSAHPTSDLLHLTNRLDVLLSDDRFLNNHPHVDSDGRSVPIASTLDLLDSLASSGAMSEADRRIHRTRLRRAGYLFIPVAKDELLWQLRTAAVRNGRLVETAELRAVRESVLLTRINDYLQLPAELPWLATTLQAFVAALKDLWRESTNPSDTSARADWILGQIDPRGWAHRLPSEEAGPVTEANRAQQFVQLLLPHPETSPEVKEQYWEWIETRLLKPIQETEPRLYSWLVETFRQIVSSAADNGQADTESDDE